MSELPPEDWKKFIGVDAKIDGKRRVRGRAADARAEVVADVSVLRVGYNATVTEPGAPDNHRAPENAWAAVKSDQARPAARTLHSAIVSVMPS